MSKNRCRYLLSSRCVYSIIKRFSEDDINKCLKCEIPIWHKVIGPDKVHVDDIYISAVTPMIIRGKLEKHIARKLKTEDSDSTKEKQKTTKHSLIDLRKWESRAKSFFKNFESKDRIIAMDHKIALQWGDLLGEHTIYKEVDGNHYEIQHTTKVEIATALVGRNRVNFEYVDPQLSADYKKNSYTKIYCGERELKELKRPKSST